MLTIPVMLTNLNDENKAQYAADLHAAGAKRLLICVLEFFVEGEERIAALEKLRRMIVFFENCGLEVGVWTNTLGWGTPREADFYARFSNATRITGFDGNTCPAVCLLDPEYRAEMLRQLMEFAEAGAKLLLLDDDLILSARSNLGCACGHHLKYLSQRAGKRILREELESFFTGAPNPDRNLFLQAQGETILEYCRDVRRSVDTISPEIRIGLCASYTLFDIEGIDPREAVRILAGKHRPLLRLSGATYWAAFAPRLPDREGLASVIETLRAQIAWLRESGIELLDENDPSPRDHRIVPAAMVELYDRMMIASGHGIGRMKYILHYEPDRKTGDTSYLNAHLRNLPFEAELTGIFADKSPIGWRVFQQERLVRDAWLPERYPGARPLMSFCTQPRGGAWIAENGLPTAYENCGGAGVAFWENARHLTEKDLSNGMLLDAEAARILMERGIEIGILSMTPANTPIWEYFPEQGRKSAISEPAGTFYRFTLGNRARAVSEFETASGERFPACIVSENAKGQKFAIYACDGNSLKYAIGPYDGGSGVVLARGRQQQLYQLYEFLTGKTLPGCVPGNPSLYLHAGRNGNHLALLLCNCHPDLVDQPKILLDAEYRLLSTVHCSATVTQQAVELSCLAGYGWAALELERLS